MKIEQKPTIHLEAVLVITEKEARMLEHLTDGSLDDIVRALYNYAGFDRATHGEALESFLEDVRAQIPPMLRRLETAHAAFTNCPHNK